MEQQQPDAYIVDSGNWRKLNDTLERINLRFLEVEKALDNLHQQIVDILNAES